MFTLLLVLFFITFVIAVTWLSYRMGTTKTEHPKICAVLGFALAFFPPLALIYLVILLLKEDVSIV